MNSSESWKIVIDIPEVLHFSAYVGQQENFRLPQVAEASTSAEKEWQVWWAALPFANVSFSRWFQSALEQRQADPSMLELLRQFDFENFSWRPPDFENLAATPALQNLFRSYWLKFVQISGAELLAIIKKYEKQLSRLHFPRLVQECIAAKAEVTTPNFALKVDIVPWPTNYLADISDDYLILGLDYFEPAKSEDLRNLLKQKILNLL
jgi:hypothetical protein